jgi:hypothetical protein
MSKYSFFIVIGFWACITGTASSQIIEQDSLALVALYNATNGAGWNNKTNWLQGPVSTWYGIGTVGNRVDTVGLDNNGLTGTLPEAIGSLTSLKGLYLQNPGLSGPLPTSIANLVGLRRFYISGGNLRENIPVQFGALTNLEALSISGTKLSGTIPNELGNLRKLEFLLLVLNDSLEGPLPESILSLPRLRLLVLLNTKLAGSTIPSAIGNAAALEQIIAASSGFQGAIPAELTQLKKFERLVVDDNDFDQLPELTTMSSLDLVSIANNRLTFEDIEPNLALRNQGKAFLYTPQKPVYDPQTITAKAGSRLILKSEVGGTANNYHWVKDGAPLADVTGPTLTLENLSATQAGSYSAAITSTLVTDLTLQRNPVQLEVIASEPVSFCGQAILDATRNIPNATYTWSTGATTPAITVTTAGNYTVSIETANYTLVETYTTQPGQSDLVSGKDISFSIAIAGQTTPAEQALLTNGPVGFVNTSSAGTGFTWDFGDGTTTDEENPSHAFPNPGTYVVLLTGFDDKGCGTTYQYPVEVQELFVTNAITPNHDGDNDQLFVEPFLYPASLKILNRWGQEVFYSSHYQNDFTGADLAAGVYFFELKISDADKHVTGSLTILKTPNK